MMAVCVGLIPSGDGIWRRTKLPILWRMRRGKQETRSTTTILSSTSETLKAIYQACFIGIAPKFCQIRRVHQTCWSLMVKFFSTSWCIRTSKSCFQFCLQLFLNPNIAKKDQRLKVGKLSRLYTGTSQTYWYNFVTYYVIRNVMQFMCACTNTKSISQLKWNERHYLGCTV
jgi:hypothetical protein